MLKRIFALLLVLLCLTSSVSAETTLYVNNPNPADRLNLRTKPDQESESLGRYYNGTEVTVLRNLNSEWVEVTVGIGNAVQRGYMMSKYLSLNEPNDAMPQYISTAKMTAYHHPDKKSKTMTFDAGRMISVAGFIESAAGDWYHVMVHTGDSEGSYYTFLPESGLQIKALAPGHGVNVYISNPDKTDRLHLRAEPSIDSKSLGKYYNGCEGIMTGFAEDGEWIRVEMYGQTGWMKSEFLTIEGQRNNTYYGIPTVQSTSALTPVYAKADLDKDNYEAKIDQGTQMKVLGLVGEDMLHVQLESGGLWYVYTADTNFVDPKP